MITSLQDTVQIGDAERQQAAALLASHLAEGRLTLEEYDERVQAGYAARTQADLAPLFSDLPVPAVGAPRARRSRVPGHRPSPVVLLAAFLLVAASVAFHVPLFPLLAVFWFRAAVVRRRGYGPGHRRPRSYA